MTWIIVISSLPSHTGQHCPGIILGFAQYTQASVRHDQSKYPPYWYWHTHVLQSVCLMVLMCWYCIPLKEHVDDLGVVGAGVDVAKRKKKAKQTRCILLKQLSNKPSVVSLFSTITLVKKLWYLIK